MLLSGSGSNLDNVVKVCVFSCKNASECPLWVESRHYNRTFLLAEMEAADVLEVSFLMDLHCQPRPSYKNDNHPEGGHGGGRSGSVTGAFSGSEPLAVAKLSTRVCVCVHMSGLLVERIKGRG